jgi:phosphoglycolate phosphatase-like HAD superfamily hydrolase
MIKAVIFDYGGTLANSDKQWDMVSEKAVERLSLDGIDVKTIDFQNAIMDTVKWSRTIHAEGREANSHMFFNHARVAR